MTYSNEDLSLYVAGEFDGDVSALEQALKENSVLRQRLAKEAQLEMSLRQLGRSVPFCPACSDISRDNRCQSCGCVRQAGGFQISSVLVQNAHGRLYKAVDSDGRVVALKELAFVQAPSTSVLSAFEREAKFLRSLNHPSIPNFIANFQEGSGVGTRLYLAQEFIEGESLQTKIAKHRYSEADIKSIANHVLDILIYLQELSPAVIHRDIKPANLILKPDGSIALVDFGAAHDQGDTMATAVGTFGYMPLEQLAGMIDTTTDTYALGATLLHVLTRREPWKIFDDGGFESANISKPMRQFLSKMTAKSSKDRFQNAQAAKSALNRLGDAKSIFNFDLSKTRWLPWMAAGGLAIAGLGTGANMMFESSRQTKAQEASLLEIKDELEGYLENGTATEYQKTLREYFATDFSEKIPSFRTHTSLPHGPAVNWAFKDTIVSNALLAIAEDHVNIVFSSDIGGSVFGEFNGASWPEAVEAFLQNQELHSSYDPEGNILIVHTSENMRAMLRSEYDGLNYPSRVKYSNKIGLNFSDTEISDLISRLAEMASINYVAPESFSGKINVKMKNVPWNLAFESILIASGHWYYYPEHSSVLQIRPFSGTDLPDKKLCNPDDPLCTL